MVILVNKCDNWHSPASQELIAVCDNSDSIKDVLNQYVEKYDMKPLSEQDWKQIENYWQTQGYEGEGEFHLQVFQDEDINTLL